jgi:2-hydroxy-6-oxonona-2,4-dienedioate hydrolase
VKSLFANEEAKGKMIAWAERFRARIGAATSSTEVETRFGRTHVLIGGPEGGPPLVLLHGALASSAHALRELAPLLATFRTYAVDILGQSPLGADARLSVSNDDCGHFLVDVLDGLGIERAHVVGVSWGGFVAIRLAAVAPHRIDRLVLLVPAGVVRGPFFAGLFKLGIPLGLYRMSPSEGRLRAFTRHLVTTSDEDWIAYLGDAFRCYQLDMQVPALVKKGELAHCHAPTMVLGADRDLSFPGRKLLDRAPDVFPGLAATALIEGSRHCPPTTDDFRAWLSDRITGFLLAR